MKLRRNIHVDQVSLLKDLYERLRRKLFRLTIYELRIIVIDLGHVVSLNSPREASEFFGNMKTAKVFVN